MSSYSNEQIAHARNTGNRHDIVGSDDENGHPGLNDDLDAFRHAFTWANLTNAYGPVIANVMGRLNELTSEDEYQTKMDIHNNDVGIAIAQRTPQTGDIAKTVAHAVKAGITINNPYTENLTDPNRPSVTSFLDARDLFNFENQLAAQNSPPDIDQDIATAPDSPTPGVTANAGIGMFGEDYGPDVSADPDAGGGHADAGDGPEGGGDASGSSAGEFGSDTGGGSGSGWGVPVVLDLGNDGITVIPLSQSTARFDLAGTGSRQIVAWPGPDDALLVYDKDGDRLISERDEIAFADYLENAKTDLEGLAWFDQVAQGGNADGVLDKRDSKWSGFGVWRDADQDGETDPGELRMTAEGGLSSLDLTSDQQPVDAGPDAKVFGKSTYDYLDHDGVVQTGETYDTALRYKQTLDQNSAASDQHSRIDEGVVRLPWLVRRDGQSPSPGEIIYPAMAYDETLYEPWPDWALRTASEMYPDRYAR